MRQLIGAAAVLVAASAYTFVASGSQAPASPPPTDQAAGKTERHLRNIRKLTSGGENAEAYFSADGTRLIYQSTRPEYPCDQIYTCLLYTSPSPRDSTGTGRT